MRAVGVSILFALGMVAGGCGARSGPATDGGGPDGADGAADPSVRTETSPEIPPPPCTLGEDQTCNDDPRVSALWGACVASGACSCRDGFSVNRATGRCRPGTACVASATDPWAVKVRLDSQNCASRPAAACDVPAGTSADPIIAAVGALAMGKCHLPPYAILRVELLEGCPTTLELDREPGDSSIVMCLSQVLSSEKWDCGGATACVLYEWDTLP